VFEAAADVVQVVPALTPTSCGVCSSCRITASARTSSAFVVSTDGPVTVCCDGQRSADLKRAAFRKTADTIEELSAERSAERRT
jgi:hypothetical protein